MNENGSEDWIEQESVKKQREICYKKEDMNEKYVMDE